MEPMTELICLTVDSCGTTASHTQGGMVQSQTMMLADSNSFAWSTPQGPSLLASSSDSITETTITSPTKPFVPPMLSERCTVPTTFVEERQAMMGMGPSNVPVSSPTLGHDELNLIFTAEAIQNRMNQIFPDDLALPQRVPCVSARIFACFSLRRPARSLSSAMLSFLQALVRVEAVSLLPVGDEEWSRPPNKRRRVHFDGSTCSAVLPPVDRVGESSDFHRPAIIAALTSAKEQVDRIVSVSKIVLDSGPENDNQVRILKELDDLLQFLCEMECTTGQDKEAFCRCEQQLEEITKATQPYYPAGRVRKIISQYRQEIAIIISRIRLTNINPSVALPLQVEQTLAMNIGQAIRWGLRRLFNPPPPDITTNDPSYLSMRPSYSKVAEFVSLQIPRTGNNQAADNSCISVLISRALSMIHASGGMDILQNGKLNAAKNFPDIFTDGRLSQLGFNVRRKETTQLAHHELQELLAAIRRAGFHTATVRACRFLVDLLTAPMVQAEIERQGGWSRIQMYAMLGRKYDLWGNTSVDHDDAHLAQLYDVEQFVHFMEQYLSETQLISELYETCLKEVSKRFHISTKSIAVLNRFPQIEAISKCFKENEIYPILPDVHVTSQR